MGRVENVKSMAEKKNVTDKNQKHERNLENSAKKTYPINCTHRWTTNKSVDSAARLSGFSFKYGWHC